MDTEITTNDKIKIITSAANSVIAKKFCPPLLERDDLISMGYIAFEEEVLPKWDNTISKNFELYAFWIVRNRIIDGIRKLCKHEKYAQRVSLENIEHSRDALYIEMFAEDDSTFDDIDESKYLLQILDKEQVDLLHRRFVLEMTLVAIANEFGISSDQALYRINKALSKVRTKTPTHP